MATIERGVDGIISVLTTDADEWHAKVRVRSEDRQSLLDLLFPILVPILIIFVFGYMVRSARGTSGRGGRTTFLPYGGSPWGGGSGSGGGSSWGGSGGGGFSGGGGSSGGGGASGSW